MSRVAELPLAHGALVIAEDEYPDLPVFKYLKRLDFMGYELQSRLSRVSGRVSQSPMEERLEAVLGFLFSEQGFQGNSLNYYDPKNSFLNEVLDRRLGLPITLSILTIEMCTRVGIKAWGLGFPSHFMVGVELARGESVVLDPFHGGARLTAEQVRERLESKKPESFVMDNRAIFSRLLQNLKTIYWNEGRFEKALPVLERLVEMNPDHVIEFRDRGLAHHQLKRYAHALIDLERYLLEVDQRHVAIPSAEFEAVKDLIQWLRKRAPASPTLH